MVDRVIERSEREVPTETHIVHEDNTRDRGSNTGVIIAVIVLIILFLLIFGRGWFGGSSGSGGGTNTSSTGQ